MHRITLLWGRPSPAPRHTRPFPPRPPWSPRAPRAPFRRSTAVLRTCPAWSREGLPKLRGKEIQANIQTQAIYSSVRTPRQGRSLSVPVYINAHRGPDAVMVHRCVLGVQPLNNNRVRFRRDHVRRPGQWFQHSHRQPGHGDSILDTNLVIFSISTVFPVFRVICRNVNTRTKHRDNPWHCFRSSAPGGRGFHPLEETAGRAGSETL